MVVDRAEHVVDRLPRRSPADAGAFNGALHADLAVPILSPRDLAQALGYPLERITKTLLLRCVQTTTYGMALCSVNKKVNMALIAGQLGCKRVELASSDELLAQLDNPSTGVSPIGAGSIPVFMDAALLEFPTILIGAGVVGEEIELSPAQLQAITHALVLPIAI